MEIAIDMFIVVEITFAITCLLAALAYPFFTLAEDAEHDQLRPRRSTTQLRWHLE